MMDTPMSAPRSALVCLPTLQKQMLRAFLRLVVWFGLLGLILVGAIFISGRMPTLLVRMNYDSIAHARLMEEAMNGVYLPSIFTEKDAAAWQAQFAAALELAAGNITEGDEALAVDSIRAEWMHFRRTPDPAAYTALRRALTHLVQVNERGMFVRLDENARFRDLTLLGAAAVFLIGTLGAFFLADSVATRLSHPLRRAAALLKSRPDLGKRLHLPAPQTLEVRFLFDELSRIWGRLGELDALNVGNLRAEKRKLEIILESAEDAVLALDAGGTVLLVSERMLSLLHMRRDEVIGRSWHDLSTASENYLALRTALRQDMQGTQTIALCSDDEEQHYKARRRDLLGSQDQAAGQVFLLSDVTEKRRRDAMRSEMMDWISHELKTPMQSLGLAADLMARRENMDAELLMLVDIVRQDVGRLRTVARQFMDIAHMSPTARQLSLERVDVAARLPDWLAPFQLIARESHMHLELAAASIPMPIMLDTERFAWVLSNLVSNALRVCEAGATVRVSLHPEPELAATHADHRPHALLVVEDDGPGMSAELEARLFQPFSHGRTAGSRDGLVGLGLAIARGIVEAHGGAVSYAHGAQGGSVFTVRLPLADEYRVT